MEDSAGRRGYVVRSDPPPGQTIIATDRLREWSTLRALSEAGTIPLPTPLWFDPSGEELGALTIVSEMIEGPSLLSTALPLDARERRVKAEPFADVAATIHGFDLAGLPDHLEMPASWDDYIDSRIQEWIDMEKGHVERDPFMRLIASWLKANKPPPAPLGLVHGDFQPANVVIAPDGTYYMVDWELARVGDPREDLGWMNLCGITQPPNVIEHDPESWYARYRELSGLSEDVLNPTTIVYFTVLGGGTVFQLVQEQSAALARGELTGISVAYMSNALMGLHNMFMNAMAEHASLSGGAK